MAINDKTTLYRQVDLDARVESANPHQLIAILFDEVISALKRTLVALERGNHQYQGQQAGRAIKILSGLRESLDAGIDSELPHQLDRLYEYMQRIVFEANRENSRVKFEEVMDLLLTIQSGWEGIADQAD